MSRKRPKNKRTEEAVPEEVLAEGSGPNEVVDANPQALAAAAEVLVDKRKSKRRKGNVEEAPAEPAFDASAGNVLAETPDEEEAALAEAEAASDEDAILRAEAEAELGAVETSEDAALLAAAAAELGPAEAQVERSVEDAVLRAEAEAELGAAEEPGADGEEVADELAAALPTTAATMDAAQLKNLVEALVFAADKPVTLQRLRQLTRVSDIKRLEQALAELATDYVNRGIALQQVSGGYQFRTNTQYSVWVQQLIAGRPVRLSRAQLETLAIVAYRQPITRPEIDEIRGVDSSATLRLLLDRALIRTLGKKEDVGRPMLYGTTKEFLDFFSLSDLRELPTLREYSELTAESRKVMSDRLGVDANTDSSEAVEDADLPAEAPPPPEPTTDDVLAAYVADGDATAAADAVAAVDASARSVEVDAWGQVIGAPEDEPVEQVSTSADDDSLDSLDSVDAGQADADGEAAEASAGDEDLGAPAGGSIADRVGLAEAEEHAEHEAHADHDPDAEPDAEHGGEPEPHLEAAADTDVDAEHADAAFADETSGDATDDETSQS